MIGYICGVVFCTALLCTAFSRRLRLCEYDIKSDKLNSELRILQISDLHDCKFGKEQEKLIRLVSEARPDVILLTGDIVNDTNELTGKMPILSDGHPVKPLLDGIISIAPVYMVYGNHEANIKEIDELTAELAAMGIRLIGQKSDRIVLNGQRIDIFGIDDPRFFGAGKQKMSLFERLSDDRTRTSPGLEAWRDELSRLRPDNEVFSLLLSHRPEEYERYGDFNLTFSGHAHGGQWRIPFILNGLYAPHQGLFPKHAGGVYRLDTGNIHIVSRGLSLIRCPRVFNRPEVWLVRCSGKND